MRHGRNAGNATWSGPFARISRVSSGNVTPRLAFQATPRGFNARTAQPTQCRSQLGRTDCC
jgi:hypothetical protein